MRVVRRSELEDLHSQLAESLLERSAQRTTLRLQRERLVKMRTLLDEHFTAFLAEKRTSAEQTRRLREAQQEIARLQVEVDRLQRIVNRCSGDGRVREAS